MSQRPHPANAPGDFYVEDGCCTLCEVPFIEAESLFAWWPNPRTPKHCYVKRQPQSAKEVGQMVNAILGAELQCIHYRGHDIDLITQLVGKGEGAVCDNLPPHLRKVVDQMEADRVRRAKERWE